VGIWEIGLRTDNGDDSDPKRFFRLEYLCLMERHTKPSVRANICGRDFHAGKWLRFKFTGSGQKSKSSAVLSAVMFDKAP